MELLELGADSKVGGETRGDLRSLNAQRRRSIEASAGSQQTPFRFNTVLLLLANLRVPDSALLVSELQLRTRIKYKANQLFMKNKAIATLQTYIAMSRSQRAVHSPRLSSQQMNGVWRGSSMGIAMRNGSLQRQQILSNVRSGVRICSSKMRERKARSEQRIKDTNTEANPGYEDWYGTAVVSEELQKEGEGGGGGGDGDGDGGGQGGSVQPPPLGTPGGV